MKSITVQADERLIEAAEARARLEHTTLDEKIQLWLIDYVGRETRVKRYSEVMTALRGKVRVGRKLTRDEMNAR